MRVPVSLFVRMPTEGGHKVANSLETQKKEELPKKQNDTTKNVARKEAQKEAQNGWSYA